MFFKQFFLPSLGHASYIVGDEGTGKALVLDPRRDVDCYFDALRAEGLRLAYAVDTHGHNDYLSGISEVAGRQDVEALGYHDAPLGYDHTPVKDGEMIEFGDVAIEILHTPGHTPEHISLLVYDRSVGEVPTLLLSGGALLVGDIARPDLLGGPDQAREAARSFCHTIQEKILWRLSDDVEVWPTHVSGSLCGGNIGSRLSTTVGYERKTNSVLARVDTSERFVEECIRLDDLPAVPPYWRRMRAQNMAGPPLLGSLREPLALPPDLFEEEVADAVILDTRSPDAYAGAHIPGALNVGWSTSFPTWAGTALPDGAPVLLVLEDPSMLWDVCWELLRIGYPLPIGWLAGGMAGWRTSGRVVQALPQIDVHELNELLARDRDLTLLDVRQPGEYSGGHAEGATFITGAELPSRLDEIPKSEPVAVICGSGYRSSVAAALLLRNGHRHVTHVLGGMSAWRAAGYPVETFR